MRPRFFSWKAFGNQAAAAAGERHPLVCVCSARRASRSLVITETQRSWAVEAHPKLAVDNCNCLGCEAATRLILAAPQSREHARTHNDEQHRNIHTRRTTHTAV